MAHELRELLRQAAAEPDHDLDVVDLRRRGRRARRRRQLATAGSAATVLVLVVAGLLVGVDRLTGPPDVAIEDDRPVLPDVARRVVAEGTFDNDLGPWTMRAWTRGGTELCFQGPLASPCVKPNPAGRRFLTSVVTGERDGVPVGCAGVAARPRVATVEVAFTNGTGRLLTSPVDEAGLRFFATCWTGQRAVREVNGLDADGQQVASVGYDVTVEPTHPAPPRPAGVKVAAGSYEGSDESWTLHGWWNEAGELCLRLEPGWSERCLPRAASDQPGALPGLQRTESLEGDQWSGCVYGTVGPAATAVELVFSDGRRRQVTPVHTDLQPPATVFAHCWTGRHRVRDAHSIDADGQVLDGLDT